MVEPADDNGHVTKLTFGLDRVGKPGSIDDLLENAPAVRPSTAERMTREAYQTEYGICDHKSPFRHPFASVLLHPKENAVEGGPYRSILRKYVHYRIWDTWHLSIKDFLASDYPDAMYYLQVCESTNLKTDSETTRIQNEFNRLNPNAPTKK